MRAVTIGTTSKSCSGHVPTRSSRRHGEDELRLFTGHVSRNYTDVAYGEGAFLLFGRESRGLDEAFIQRYLDACVRIPMRENERSLNLSNAVAIATYEALRQQSWPNMS